MNTTMIVEDVDGAVIDKNETDHDGSLQISTECDHPSRQSVSCHAPKMTLSPVARLVKPVMVAAALMMSVPSVSFATVSFNEGQIVDKSGDTYSVKQPGGSVWSGVERSELTAQQIKGYEMAQAAAKAKGDALTTANQTRTQQQIQAGAQAMMVSLTTSKIASANSTINVSAGSLGDMPVKTAHGETVLASSLPANTQVSKPYNSALFGSVTRASNGGNNSNNGEGSHGGTGNGGENAQASHSAGGFSDDHDHIGGGHTGGGFHY